MVSPGTFIDALTERRFGPYFGVPCSLFHPLIDFVLDSTGLEYYPLTNEGESVAVASGAALCGSTPVVLFQNSGLGNAVNPLTSLSAIFDIPLLLIASWRGEPGISDEPQHRVMGRITPALLDLMEIRWAPFPQQDAEVRASVETATASIAETGRPYALLMRKGSVAAHRRTTVPPTVAGRPGRLVAPPPPGERASRYDTLAALIRQTGDRALVVATTGKTGRELFTLGDRDNHLYMVGSMGCAASFGLGLALGQRERPVVVIDGDGAALMRLEAMASIGRFGPTHLVHLVLDNGTYDSTGGQETIADTVDFPAIALACGYASASTFEGLQATGDRLGAALAGGGPHLLHIRIQPGSRPDLGRPTVTPAQVAARLRALVQGPPGHERP